MSRPLLSLVILSTLTSGFVYAHSLLVAPHEAPKVIFLNRSSVTIRAGRDSAAELRSSLLEEGATAALAGYAGTDESWRDIVRCVAREFSAYDVVVVDRRPAEGSYVMVHVGDTSKSLGKRRHLAGISPFTGEVMKGPIVHVFSATMGNRPGRICRTIAHEVGHAYGLDHSFRCKDHMGYLEGCGSKRFMFRPIPCGEREQRPCSDGDLRQNPHRLLLGVLGPR